MYLVGQPLTWTLLDKHWHVPCRTNTDMYPVGQTLIWTLLDKHWHVPCRTNTDMYFVGQTLTCTLLLAVGQIPLTSHKNVRRQQVRKCRAKNSSYLLFQLSTTSHRFLFRLFKLSAMTYSSACLSRESNVWAESPWSGTASGFCGPWRLEAFFSTASTCSWNLLCSSCTRKKNSCFHRKLKLTLSKVSQWKPSTCYYGAARSQTEKLTRGTNHYSVELNIPFWYAICFCFWRTKRKKTSRDRANRLYFPYLEGSS